MTSVEQYFFFMKGRFQVQGNVWRVLSTLIEEDQSMDDGICWIFRIYRWFADESGNFEVIRVTYFTTVASDDCFSFNSTRKSSGDRKYCRQAAWTHMFPKENNAIFRGDSLLLAPRLSCPAGALAQSAMTWHSACKTEGDSWAHFMISQTGIMSVRKASELEKKIQSRTNLYPAYLHCSFAYDIFAELVWVSDKVT